MGRIEAKFSIGDVIQYIKWESIEVWQGTIVGITLSEPNIDGDRHIEYEIGRCGRRITIPERDCYADEIEARKEVIKHLEALVGRNQRIIKRLENEEAKRHDD